MNSLLESLVLYLAKNCSIFTAGKNIFYNEMPDKPDECLVLQERTSNSIPAQFNLEKHNVVVIARANNNAVAYDNACACYRWLFTDEANYSATHTEEFDTTGIIQIADNLTVSTQLWGTPIWLKTDDKGRKYFGFNATVLSKRLI